MIRLKTFKYLIFVFICLLFACEPASSTPPKQTVEQVATTVAQSIVDKAHYPWLQDWQEHPPMVTLVSKFPVPQGYERVTVQPKTYSHWLRHLPIRTDRTNVLSFRGYRLSRPSAAIVAIDVGTRDLQQCADSVIRLHAEYQ